MNIRLSFISFILRVGLAFAYIFIAILCFYAPEQLTQYTAPLLTPDGNVLPILLELLSLCMSAWLLSGKVILLSSGISFLILFMILSLNIEKPFVIFTSVQTLCINLALILSQQMRKKQINTKEPGEAPAPIIIATAKPVAEEKAETIL